MSVPQKFYYHWEFNFYLCHWKFNFTTTVKNLTKSIESLRIQGHLDESQNHLKNRRNTCDKSWCLRKMNNSIYKIILIYSQCLFEGVTEVSVPQKFYYHWEFKFYLCHWKFNFTTAVKNLKRSIESLGIQGHLDESQNHLKNRKNTCDKSWCLRKMNNSIYKIILIYS